MIPVDKDDPCTMQLLLIAMWALGFPVTILKEEGATQHIELCNIIKGGWTWRSISTGGESGSK